MYVLCMYMHVCMYVCMYVYMYVCMYLCIYVSMYLCIYVCIYVCMYVVVIVVVVVVLTFNVLVANPKKTTLHGGQSRSWSAEQGKESKRQSLAAYPPPYPPHCLFGEKKKKKITRRIYRRYAGLGRSRVRTRIPSACRLGQWVWLRKILHSRLR